MILMSIIFQPTMSSRDHNFLKGKIKMQLSKTWQKINSKCDSRKGFGQKPLNTACTHKCEQLMNYPPLLYPTHSVLS